MTTKCNSIGRIALANGGFALIDEEDRPRLERFKWYCGGRGYAVRYFREAGKRKSALMHRLIMNAPDGQQIDHINGDRTDNRKANLRFATQAQNMANRKMKSDSRGRFKGVLWAHGKYWRAYINKTHLGHFPTEEEAARAYDRAAWERYGEFAKLNFPDEDPSKHPPLKCKLHQFIGGTKCLRCGAPVHAGYKYRRQKRHNAGVKQDG